MNDPEHDACKHNDDDDPMRRSLYCSLGEKEKFGAE